MADTETIDGKPRSPIPDSVVEAMAEAAGVPLAEARGLVLHSPETLAVWNAMMLTRVFHLLDEFEPILRASFDNPAARAMRAARQVAGRLVTDRK